MLNVCLSCSYGDELSHDISPLIKLLSLPLLLKKALNKIISFAVSLRSGFLLFNLHFIKRKKQNGEGLEYLQ